MNGRTLIRAIASCLTLALAACATAPRQESSILDAMSGRSMSQPQSCEAMGAATVCVQTSRLGPNESCGCVDRHQITDGKRFGGF